MIDWYDHCSSLDWRMKRRIIGILLMVLSTGIQAGERQSTPWLVYYADKAPLATFDAYQLLVLDSHYHPPLRPLADRGKTLLGYLSLGELAQHRPYFPAVKAEGLLLVENSNWPGSFFVDVRDRRWTERVIVELIPALLRKGFDGVFIDTLDNPPHLEREDPTRYRGMTAAAVRLVRTIRLHYPHIKIMLNRAYELLPEVAGDIDMVLGESVYADYDFEARRYQRVDEALYQSQVAMLQDAQQRNPALRVFTLDYWDPNDTQGLREIYRRQRAQGFSPYVATIALDEIIAEPTL